MLPCPLYYLTHLKCPLCGAQRGLVALWHGDVASWWHYNPVLWLLLPYFAILVAGELYRPWQNKTWVRFCYSDKAIFSVMGILILWGIVRNL